MTLQPLEKPDLVTDRHSAKVQRNDALFRHTSRLAAILVMVILFGILFSMIWSAWPAFQHFGFGFFSSTQWNVKTGEYGAVVAVAGTIISSLIALVIGVPISIGIAVFLTQLCPEMLKRPIAMTIELLAAVPSIIFGMWGLFVLAPILARFVQIPVSQLVEGIPLVGSLFHAAVPSGLGILTAGIILAIMIIPSIASFLRDVLEQIPAVLRESAFGLGCTTYETVRHVLLPQAGASIVGAVMLGLGRALGETMAVTFVIGNSNRLSASLFDPGSTIASRIANEFQEADAMQLHALMALGCILFLITFIILVCSRLLIMRARTFQ